MIQSAFIQVKSRKSRDKRKIKSWILAGHVGTVTDTFDFVKLAKLLTFIFYCSVAGATWHGPVQSGATNIHTGAAFIS